MQTVDAWAGKARRQFAWIIATLVAMAVLSTAALAQGAPPLFDAAPRSGSLAVELRPTEVVAVGQTQLVTFGVPFPRGALLPTELAQVRLLVNGAEVPIWVDMLTPWRHLGDPAQDGSSVRVLRVQLQHTFGSPVAPVPALLSWNQSPRTLSRSSLVEPRSGWHRVVDGTTSTGGATFGASHDVFEPNVYALLPKAWLARSGLKNPVQPFADTVTEARRNPAEMAARYPGYEEADHAQVNFFYTILNDDEPNTAPSVGTNTNDFSAAGAYEPWLYDRAMVMFVGYLRGGQFRMLREAVRNADFYRQQLWTPADCDTEPFRHACVGSFKGKNADPRNPWHDAKYSYNESLAFVHWLTGDNAPLAPVEHATRQYTDSAAVNATFWTERHMGLKLMAEVVAWELTGKPEYRTRLQQTLADLRRGQTAPYGGLVDGGIWHATRGHEGDDSDEPITSPWMSALIVDAAMRAVVAGETSQAVPLVEGLAGHVCGRGTYLSNLPLRAQSGGATLRVPHYLATRDGVGREVDPYGTVEHAHDVAGIAAWGAYFRARAGDTTASAALRGCANELYTTFDHLITNWTRPGTANYDAYRVNPPRKYTWWFKNTSGFGWAMAAAGGTPAPGLTVSLTSPVNGAQFTAPASFTLSAAPSGANGLARVEFWRNGVRIGEDTTPPYSLAVTALAAGQYRFEALAVPASGAVVRSASVDVVVNPGTTTSAVAVTLTQPGNGAVFTAPASIALRASASPTTAVARVEFWGNGIKLAEDSTSPYSANLVGVGAGSYRFEARAITSSGSVVVSAPSTVRIDGAPPPAASVALASPANGASIPLGSPMTLSATVSGTTAVTRVEFLDGSSVVLTDARAPYGGTWTPTAAGRYPMRARARLVDGRVIESAVATVLVSAAPPAGALVTLRQGLDGYQGVTDLSVSNQYVQYNNGRGVVANDAQSGAYRISGTSGYEVRSFLRFAGLERYRGRRLLKAELVLHFAWGASGYTLAGAVLAVPWNPASTSFGWSQRDTGLAWAQPGSGGSDWSAGKSFTVSGFASGQADLRRVAIDTAVVQGWIDDPAGNHGLVLLPTVADKVAWLRSSEDTTLAWRPALELTFE